MTHEAALTHVNCRRTVVIIVIRRLGVDEAALAEVCRRHGIARLEVFGSVARGDAEGQSDVDLLYELAPGSRLGWHIEDLADELSELLGRRVDLVSRNALHNRLRDSVLAEASLLFADENGQTG